MQAVNLQSNIFWHGRVKHIIHGESPSGLRWAIVQAEGKSGARDTLDPNNVITHYQSMDIYTVSGLADYVENELEIGDPIFVVGQLIVKKTKKGQTYFHKLCCQAEYIYKEDCLKFYGKG